MKKRDCKTGLAISDADWQRFEKFLPEPKAPPDGDIKPNAPIRGCKIIVDETSVTTIKYRCLTPFYNSPVA